MYLLFVECKLMTNIRNKGSLAAVPDRTFDEVRFVDRFCLLLDELIGADCRNISERNHRGGNQLPRL